MQEYLEILTSTVRTKRNVYNNLESKEILHLKRTILTENLQKSTD